MWLASPSSGTQRSAPGLQTAPFLPAVPIIQRIPALDSKRRTGGPEGPLFACPIQPAEIRPERSTLAPFAPREHISLMAFRAKPGNACGPRTGGSDDIHFEPQPGPMGRQGQAPGGELAPEQPIACEPGMQKDAWRPKVLKPSEPVPSPTVSIPFETQTGSATEIRRPKQALRELVQPSARPWYSLTIPWQSFLGFHLALPPAEGTALVTVQTPASVALWNSTTEMPLGGRRYLPEWQELAWEHEASAEGAATDLPEIEPVAVTVPFSPLPNAAFQGTRPPVEDREPFTKIVPETLPAAQSVTGPAPVAALSSSLPIWIGTINSYMQRNWHSPRLREGGRAVHMLRLAPSIQINEQSKISAA